MATNRTRSVQGLDKKVILSLDKKLTEVRLEILTKLKKLIGKDTLYLSDNDIFISNSNTSDIFTSINATTAGTDEAEPVRLREMSTDLLMLILEKVSDNIAMLKS